MLGWFKRKKIPVLPAKEGYDLWAKTYSQESNPIKDFSNTLAEQMLPELSEKSMLDAGCGTGHFCLLAEKNKAVRVVGLDLSQNMIDVAKKKCTRTEFHCSDLSTTPLEPESFDVIICALVIGHIENVTPVLEKISKALKKGGSLILTDFHPVLTMQQAKRTFKNLLTGETIEIRHYLHPIEEMKTTLHSLGLKIVKIEEPQWNNVPVVYGMLAKK